jgi:hypothetical protein
MTIPHTFRVTRDFDLYGTAKAFPRMSRHGLSLHSSCGYWQMHLRPGPREGKGPLLITDRGRVSQMNPTTILRSPIGDDIVGCWPEASVRCLAAIRPELGIKPTCQDGPTDAINPLRKPRPPHSITSSATASKFVGNSRPNDLAVFRLTTNRCDSGAVLRTLTRG